MTQNDEVNSLAVRECTHLFERSKVYQLTFNRENTHSRRGLTKNLMGRELFGKGNTFSEMREQHAAGAKFKATTLSEAFTYEDFVQQYDNAVILLCAVGEDGSLHLDTVDNPLVPKAGQKIVALIETVTLPSDHAATRDTDAKSSV